MIVSTYFLRVLVLGWLAFALILVGCSSNKSRVGGVLNLDTDLKLTLLADRAINPDHNTKSSPVVVRLYELNSEASFSKADFVDIFEQDEQLLGRELIGKQVFRPIIPGEEREEILVLNKETSHVALYAEFSRYQGAGYKLVFPVTRNNVFRNSVTVQISGNQLTLME